jgi:flavin-dependent dehydrogenase
VVVRRSDDPEVLVFGGGVAGLIAALRAARDGMRVVCVEPKRFPRVRVGESLDWSAPQLLGEVGLGRDELVRDRLGTLKREVHGYTSAGLRLVAGPPSWFGRWPLQFETVTLHVDRERFDRRLYETAVDAGVEFVWDRIHTVQIDNDALTGCVTSSGGVRRAQWYIDASGRSRIIGRAAHIGTHQWGCERIGLWSQRISPMTVAGTVLHLDEAADELVWAWEIPIAAERSSVGVVLPLAEFQGYRANGLTIAEVLALVLDRFPRFEATHLTSPVRTRTYQPYVSQRVAGANWVMVGEAAALVDPLSSVGVTAAIRHGTEAAEIITSSKRTPESTRRLLANYDRRIRNVASLYNDAVDSLLYRPQLRQRRGMKQAGRSYVILGYLTNTLYTRLNPSRSRSRSAAFGMVLAFFHAWVQLWRTESHTASPTRP